MTETALLLVQQRQLNQLTAELQATKELLEKYKKLAKGCDGKSAGCRYSSTWHCEACWKNFCFHCEGEEFYCDACEKRTYCKECGPNNLNKIKCPDKCGMKWTCHKCQGNVPVPNCPECYNSESDRKFIE